MRCGYSPARDPAPEAREALRRGARGGRCFPRSRSRRVLVPGRRLGLRQDDDPQAREPARRARCGHGARGRARRAHERAARAPPPDRLCVPAGRIVPAPLGGRERGDHAGVARLGEHAHRGARRRAARAGGARAGRVPRAAARRALGWTGAASRPRARARGRAARAAARRALRCARSPDAGSPPAGVRANPARARAHRDVREPRHERGAAAGGPDRGASARARRPGGHARGAARVARRRERRRAARDPAPPDRAARAPARGRCVNEALAALPADATAHLQLSLAALSLASLLSLPLGVLAAGRPRLREAALGAASVIQTVPSLALLAIMVPLLSRIGFVPALIALTLYGMLPILRNTVAGLAGVEPALREAARGVGMTPGQQLRRVDLPLAAPVIVAGLRTAAVWTVGTATLSTPVGAPNLGNLIFAGLQTRNGVAVVIGCVAAAGLALALDQTIALLERGIRERDRARKAVSLALLLALAAWTGGAFAWQRAGERAPIRIGAKPFTEQYVLAELLSGFVEHETGRRTEVLRGLGSTVLFDALRAGEIDAYVDYSGTLWATILGGGGPPPPRAELLAQVTHF